MNFLAFLLLFFLIPSRGVHQGSPLPDPAWETPNDHRAADSPEASQRLIFLLQYLATDYDRAVHNGEVVDSLEYAEMKRFSQEAAVIYQTTAATQPRTLEKLSRLRQLIADKAALASIRQICAELVGSLVKEKNLLVFPQRAPELARGEELFRENCVSCHGTGGAGDGPAADTLNPKPRDFTAAERMNDCAPLQFYQAISFGIEGTAMPSFAQAFTPDECWSVAFYLMTLRRDFQPLESSAPQKFTLRELATKNNRELQTILASQNHQKRTDSSFRYIDYWRQNPPELTLEEYVMITETHLKESLAAYLRSDSARAKLLADDAYWLGFEPIERRLQPRAYLKFEQLIAELHACIEARGPQKKARALVKAMLDILGQARRQKVLLPGS
ncbi:MAG: cytochrome c [candidate division KSB1 bacterium]|nr:cytochrome c [candidate division KSB1 bacterium]